MRKTVLVVDDEVKLAQVVGSYLEKEGYHPVLAETGREALALFEKNTPVLVILDLMLPDLSGEEVCRELRKKSRVPVIMLTAKAEEEDILGGLGIGADDYVTKPFSVRQLLARVHAVLRRVSSEAVPLSDTLSYDGGALRIDVLRREVTKNGELVPLTPNEYKILMTLVKYPSKVFTRDELISFALGDDYNGFDRVIDTHIKNIRQKLGDAGKTPRLIKTVHGVGYQFGGEKE